DIVIKPGQTWCIVTSAVEGDTLLTILAPEIENWDKRQVVATIHWVDTQWQLPAAATGRAGAALTLNTHFYRHTDQLPVPNYRVLYTLLDGPESQFMPNKTREAIATSNESGDAKIELAQLQPQPGLNRIGIEVIRPGDPNNPATAPVVVAKSETTVDWQ